MFGTSSFGSNKFGGLPFFITASYDETGKLINLIISTSLTDSFAILESRQVNLTSTITTTELGTLSERFRTININLTPTKTDVFDQTETGKLISIILNTSRSDSLTAYEQDKLISLSTTTTEADYYPVLAEIDKTINLIASLSETETLQLGELSKLIANNITVLETDRATRDEIDTLIPITATISGVRYSTPLGHIIFVVNSEKPKVNAVNINKPKIKISTVDKPKIKVMEL